MCVHEGHQKKLCINFSYEIQEVVRREKEKEKYIKKYLNTFRCVKNAFLQENIKFHYAN